MHRVDVESAFDAVTSVEHDLAVDGIDEVLDLFLVYQAEDVGPDGPGRGTVAVRTGDHIWRLTLTADDVGAVARARSRGRGRERRAVRAAAVAVGPPPRQRGARSRATANCWPGSARG